MKCSKVLDCIYEYSGNDSEPGNSMPLFNQIQVWLHILFCRDCAEKLERLEKTVNIMRKDFFPVMTKTSGFNSWSDIEDSIMAKIAIDEETESDASYANPGSLSIRGWIIAGVLIFVSFITAFLNFDFQLVVSESGNSFLVPVSITIGIVLTTYVALFIGSNLKELSKRFGL